MWEKTFQRIQKKYLKMWLVVTNVASVVDKSKHTLLSFVKGRYLTNHVNNPLFEHYEELSEQMLDVEKMKKKVLLDLPTQIGVE